MRESIRIAGRERHCLVIGREGCGSAGGVKVGEEGRFAVAAFGTEGFLFGLQGH